MFKSIFNFFGDIVRQVLIKVITFVIMAVIIILLIKYFFHIDVLGLFGF